MSRERRLLLFMDHELDILRDGLIRLTATVVDCYNHVPDGDDYDRIVDIVVAMDAALELFRATDPDTDIDWGACYVQAAALVVSPRKLPSDLVRFMSAVLQANVWGGSPALAEVIAAL